MSLLRRLTGTPLGRELPAMAAITASEGGARFLSFCFYLLAAHELTTSGFGVVRYTITLSVLAFGVGQVVVNAVTREVGAARSDRGRTSAVLGSGLVIGTVVLAASVALCLLAKLLGLTGGADLLGLIVALVGLAALQLYYGIGRGLGQVRRAASTYVGASLIQLAAFGAVAGWSQATSRTALLVYGLSSLVPVLLWEALRPVLLRGGLATHAAARRRLLALGAPLLLAELSYLIWLSADQIWVEHAFGTSQVGLYGAAKTLTQLLFVIPAGATAVLMPRVAELISAGALAQAGRLVAATVGGVIACCGLIGLALILLRTPLLGALYGHAYRAAAPSLLILTLGMVANGGFVVLTTSAVGWGRAGIYAAGMTLAAVCELVLLAVLPGDRITTAAWAATASIALALVTVAVYLLAANRRLARSRLSAS